MSGLGLFLLIFVGLVLFGYVCVTIGIRIGINLLFDVWVDNLDDDEVETLLHLAKKATIYSGIEKRYKK